MRGGAPAAHGSLLAYPRATARVPTPHPLIPRPYNDYEGAPAVSKLAMSHGISTCTDDVIRSRGQHARQRPLHHWLWHVWLLRWRDRDRRTWSERCRGHN